MALCALLPGLTLNQEVPFAVTRTDFVFVCVHVCVCVCVRVRVQDCSRDAAEVREMQSTTAYFSSVMWDPCYSLELDEGQIGVSDGDEAINQV